MVNNEEALSGSPVSWPKLRIRGHRTKKEKEKEEPLTFIVWKNNTLEVNSYGQLFITNILQNIFFCVQQKKKMV